MKKIITIILIVLIISVIVFIISTSLAAAPQVARGKTTQLAYVPPENSLPQAPTLTTLLFSGDVMLSRNVGQKMEKYNDWTWPLANIASLLSSVNLTVINLESPFTISGNHLVNAGSFSFNADPRSIAALKLAGIDVADLANNHMMNQGPKGIIDTRKILSDNDISAIGAGLNAAEASRPVIKEVNGIKFGFLGFAYPADNSVAGLSTPDIAGMNTAIMADEVNRLKNQADVVIVMMHAGTEYANEPNKQQIAFAHAAIDAGADLIIGHHPHWVQTTEIYKGKPILYSLGNLVFDQMWSQETKEGSLAKTTWHNKTLQKIELIPISIHDYGQAEIVTSTAQRQKILKRMGLTSNVIEF